MKRSRLLSLAVFLVALSAAAYFFAIRSNRDVQSVHEAAPVPDFAFPDLSGKIVHLSDFKGKVVLLDFWATWCGPCIEEVPELKAIHEKYKSRGFTIVGVSMDEEGRQVVAPFVRENRIPYPIVLADGDAGAGYPIRALPYAYLIDRRGRVIQEYIGFKFSDEVDRDILAALNAKS